MASKLFNTVQAPRVQSSKFDLSHERKFGLNMGNLIPIMVQEIVPGDDFRVSSEVMIRMAPMLAPMMHRCDVRIDYFFVPNRLVWDEWQDFITGGREGTTLPTAPYALIEEANKTQFTKGKLSDFLGLPVTTTATVSNSLLFSVLPHRGYQMIYNEFYRDQNLSEPLDISRASGQVLSASAQLAMLTTMRNRAWEKDYFTSALPWAQRGGEVLMPMEGVATADNGDFDYLATSRVFRADGTDPAAGDVRMRGQTSANLTLTNSSDVSTFNARVENLEEVRIQNASTTINDLRRANRIQEWLEKNARAGARYIEQILSHFNVKSSDARLQRPEYLGGGKSPMVISEVLSTFQSADGEGNPQANMAGHGIAVGNSNRFKKRFEEHGYVIGIMSVLPKTAYQQGIPRHFTRRDKFDYLWPEFANLGEQEVSAQELFWDPAALPATPVFGYQSRFADYKYQPSTVHGSFRDTLAYWHMGRIFTAPPLLNEAFITSDPTLRIFAVGDDDPDLEHMYCQVYNHISARRPLPYYNVPQL